MSDLRLIHHKHVNTIFPFYFTETMEKINVNHLQFTKWPNYGVPDSVGPISDFIKLTYQKAKELEAKDPELVIHCRQV